MSDLASRATSALHARPPAAPRRATEHAETFARRVSRLLKQDVDPLDVVELGRSGPYERVALRLELEGGSLTLHGSMLWKGSNHRYSVAGGGPVQASAARRRRFRPDRRASRECWNLADVGELLESVGLTA